MNGSLSLVVSGTNARGAAMDAMAPNLAGCLSSGSPREVSPVNGGARQTARVPYDPSPCGATTTRPFRCVPHLPRSFDTRMLPSRRVRYFLPAPRIRLLPAGPVAAVCRLSLRGVVQGVFGGLPHRDGLPAGQDRGVLRTGTARRPLGGGRCLRLADRRNRLVGSLLRRPRRKRPCRLVR